MIQVKIHTQSEVDNALLTAGVPFGRGELLKGGGLRLAFDGEDLPLWWEERAFWPDGSVKWIFLHTRVPAGDNELLLSTTDVKADCSASDEVEFVNGRLQLGDAILEISENRWSFKTPGGSWELVQDKVVSDPELELVRTPWKVELVEASPIAPLIRLKPKASDEGLRVDQFLRLDPVGERLIYQRRMTWHKPGKY
ncbi:MAG: hypothetical protein KAQ78_09980, partial [Candidatus Latescibacteria bacterium]|nr:hypothetical protein [Candidatus Latescibacterota bacterium]